MKVHVGGQYRKCYIVNVTTVDLPCIIQGRRHTPDALLAHFSVPDHFMALMFMVYVATGQGREAEHIYRNAYSCPTSKELAQALQCNITIEEGNVVRVHRSCQRGSLCMRHIVLTSHKLKHTVEPLYWGHH